MAHLQISEAQANALRALRPLKTADKNGYRDARGALFANIRAQLGIPADVVLSVEVDDRASPQYRALKSRPPRSKHMQYVPLEAGPDGRYVGAQAQTPRPTWCALPLNDVVALLQEQGETMEGYTVLGQVDPSTTPGVIAIPPGDVTQDGVLAYVAGDQVMFRMAE